MLGLDSRAARYTWTVVFVLSLLGIAYLIRRTLFVFIVALLFAYLLWPLVNYLDRRLPGRSKVPALAIVYIIFVGLLIVLAIAIGTRITSEASTLIVKVPQILSKIQSMSPDDSSAITLKRRLLLMLRDQVADHSQQLLALVPKAALGVLTHVGILLFVILVPILSFLFMKDGKKLLGEVLETFGDGPLRNRSQNILADIHVLLAQYIRALVLLALATFIAYSSFLFFVRVPYSFLLAAIAAPLEFVPLVGPLTGAVIILLVGGLSGFSHLLWVIAFLGIYRLFQDYVLQPHLLSAGTQLHPLVVIFGVMAGGQIAGVAGSFLSVPVMAIMRIVYRQLKSTYGSDQRRANP